MPLQKQLVPLVLAGGIDTKTDPKQVVPGKLLMLENATFVSPKQIKKSPGYTKLTTSILGSVSKEISEGEGLMSYAGELLLASSNRLYSFASGPNAWADKGGLLSVSVGGYSVNRDPVASGAADCAIYPGAGVNSGGLALYAWEEYVGADTVVNYSVVDTGTQQIVVPSTRLPTVTGTSPTGKSPRCFAIGAFFIVTWVANSGTQLMALPIPVSSPSTPAAAITVASDVQGGTYDGCLNFTPNPPFSGAPLTNAIYFAYDCSVANKLGLATLNYALAASSTNIASTTGDATGGVSIVLSSAPSDNRYAITYGGAATVYSLVINGSLTVTQAEVLLDTTTPSSVGSTFDGVVTTAWWSVKGTPVWQSFSKTNTLTGAVAGAATRFMGLFVASKPFVSGGVTFLLMGYASGDVGIQNTYFLVTADKTVKAKILANSAGFQTPTQNFPTTKGLPQVVLQPDGTYLFAAMVQSLLVSNVSSVAQQNLVQTAPPVVAATSLFSLAGVEAVELTLFTKGISYSRAEIANVLHITGGYLAMYDGAQVVEHGFHLWPEQLTMSHAAGTNTYSYIGVYEWTDAQGNKHQSAPSQAAQLATAAAPDATPVTVTFPCLRVTQKTNVVLAVYRTANSGPQFFRVTNVLAPTLSDPTVDTVTIIDNVSDANLIAGANLYTFGGVVENVSPPACSAIATGSNRLWVLSSVNPLQVWYSKQVVPGTPAAFSDLFAINMDPRGGVVTAIANMDDYEVFFKESSIFIVAGDGPDDTGQQNTFQTPKLVTTDSGCIDPRSVVLYPGGLLYKSAKGIYSLNRGLAASYVGAEVEAYNALSVVSASLVADRNQVRFNLSDGTQLVYDYFMQQWSTRPLFGLVDAAIREDQYFYLDKNGIAYAENPFSYSISDRPYSLKLKTSWLSLGGISGFQRVYGFMLLGDWKSPHTLRVSVAYDYNDSPSQVTDVLAEALDPGYWGDGFTWGDGAPPAPNGIVGQFSNYYKSPTGIVGSIADSDRDYAIAAGYVPATADEAAAAFASGTSLAAAGGYVWGGLYPLYQFRINFDRQKCTAVQITLEDLQVGVLDIAGNPAQPGEGYSISNLSFIVGVKEGWNKVGAERIAPVASP